MKNIFTSVLAALTLLFSTVPAFSAGKAVAGGKTLVVYYSYTGHTEIAAQAIAAELGADLKKIEDVERPSKIKVRTLGALAAARGQSWDIKPAVIDLSKYGRIFVGAPIWKGNPPPEINAFISGADFAGKPVIVFATMEKKPKDCLKKMSSRIEKKGGKVVGMFAVPARDSDREQIIERTKAALKGLPQLYP